MDETKALSILSALANGVNPLTGEVFPADSPYQTAEIVRALFLALSVFEATAKTRPRSQAPSNAGKPWTPEEDQELLKGFDRGTTLTALAQTHGRTPAGIQARLEKHGRLQPSANGNTQRRQWREGAGVESAKR